MALAHWTVVCIRRCKSRFPEIFNRFWPLPKTEIRFLGFSLRWASVWRCPGLPEMERLCWANPGTGKWMWLEQSCEYPAWESPKIHSVTTDNSNVFAGVAVRSFLFNISIKVPCNLQPSTEDSWCFVKSEKNYGLSRPMALAEAVARSIVWFFNLQSYRISSLGKMHSLLWWQSLSAAVHFALHHFHFSTLTVQQNSFIGNCSLKCVRFSYCPLFYQDMPNCTYLFNDHVKQDMKAMKFYSLKPAVCNGVIQDV